MRRLTAPAVVVLCFVVAVSASAADHGRVTEVWRSRYGCIGFTAPDNVDQRDGSVWVIEGGTVTHTSRAGDLLGRTPALAGPLWVTANPEDGTCWIAQGRSGELTHVASDGTVLSTTPGFEDAVRITLSPYDGSLWILGETWTGSGTPVPTYYLAHASAGGHELSRAPGFRAVVADPADGRAYACSDTATVRLGADGTQEWTASAPGTVIDEDGRDGSVWVAGQDPDTLSLVVTHLSWSGLLLSRTSGPAAAPMDLHVSHTDRSVWVTCSPADTAPLDYHQEADFSEYTAIVLHFDPTGAQVGRLDYASVQACNDRDGSVWLLQLGDSEWHLVQYSAEMQEIRRFVAGDSFVGWHAYDQTENTFWVTEDMEFRRLRPDGTVLWHHRMPLLRPVPPGLDPRDGSIWLEDQEVTGSLVHYSPEGAELEWRLSLSGVEGHVVGLLISPVDGSWWVTTGNSGTLDPPRLYHLGADGTLLSAFDGVGLPLMLDERDGSVWGTWTNAMWDGAQQPVYDSFLHHVAADDTDLLTKEYAYAIHLAGIEPDGSIWLLRNSSSDPGATRVEHLSAAGQVLASVVPALSPVCCVLSAGDGSFYVAAGYLATGTGVGWIGRMAGDGSLLWVHDGFWWPAILPDPTDGTLWTADLGNSANCVEGSAVIHYRADGTERWRSDAFHAPWPMALDPRDGSVWIWDSMTSQLIHLAPRRSPFIDVTEDHWAYDQIVACFDAGIVLGFGDDTYRPDLTVTRDAMAVYLARAIAGGDENVPTGPAQATFVDVPNTGYGEDGMDPYWAYKYVEYCVDLNIVEGYSPTHYQPTLELDRGQMAVYMARVLVTPTGDAAIPDPPTSPSFHDVTADNDWAWCYRHVEYCVAQGIVQGYFDATYRPQLLVTRDQMAVYIARTFQLPL